MESFKSRIVKTAIDVAKNYKDFFVDYEYMVCSKAFQKQKFYIIDAHEDNFLHLIGIATELSQNEFFNKCINGTINEEDISFSKPNKDEKEVKGTVRRKLKALPEINNIFNETVMVEEDFVKNNIRCSFAVGDEKYTLGFSLSYKTKPKTLLYGDMLNPTKSQKIDLVFRKSKNDKFFNELILGSKSDISYYLEDIKHLIDESILG